MTTKPFWVEDVRDAWRWFSMWVQGTGLALMGALLALDDVQRAALFELFGLSADRGVAVTALVAFASGMLARVKNQ